MLKDENHSLLVEVQREKKQRDLYSATQLQRERS